MAERDLSTRLHALLAELLGELLKRGAERAWLADKAQESVDLVHEVSEQRPPDRRRVAQLRRARRFENAVAAAVRCGYGDKEAEATVSQRQALSKWQVRRLREVAQRPRFTIPALTEEPTDET